MELIILLEKNVSVTRWNWLSFFFRWNWLFFSQWSYQTFSFAKSFLSRRVAIPRFKSRLFYQLWFMSRYLCSLFLILLSLLFDHGLCLGDWIATTRTCSLNHERLLKFSSWASFARSPIFRHSDFDLWQVISARKPESPMTTVEARLKSGQNWIIAVFCLWACRWWRYHDWIFPLLRLFLLPGFDDGVLPRQHHLGLLRVAVSAVVLGHVNRGTNLLFVFFAFADALPRLLPSFWRLSHCHDLECFLF